MARSRSLFLALFLLLPATARADAVDDLVASLRAEGYASVTVSRTLLGKARVRASGTPGEREIILDRQTGAIQRDLRDAELRRQGEYRDDGNGSDNNDGGGQPVPTPASPPAPTPAPTETNNPA